MAAPRTLLVVEDHRGFGQRFVRLLQAWGEVTLVTTLGDAIVAVQSQRWDALFVDPGLPDGSGLEAIAAFRTVQPFSPVLVVTGGCDDDERDRAWSLGARYVEKPDVSTALIEDFLRAGEALDARLAAEAWRDEVRGAYEEPRGNARPKRRGLDLLSRREREVLDGKRRGEDDKVVAYRLGLKDSTVRVLLARAATKLQCASRQELLEKIGKVGAAGPRTKQGRAAVR